MCGEDIERGDLLRGAPGRSPRVRGRLRTHNTEFTRLGSIPACAGKTDSAPNTNLPDPVDPRVCGEDSSISAVRQHVRGRSPRVRGRHDSIDRTVTRYGSIPACAGKTIQSTSCCPILRVDPRVCGEDHPSSSNHQASGGRSPRVRGRRKWKGEGTHFFGSIPACAGKTPVAPGQRSAKWVDPRVCGEDVDTSLLGKPRLGRSPRVRGRHELARPLVVIAGSIPACAGKTPVAPGQRSDSWVDPRVCGEDSGPSVWTGWTTGRSPRVRGRPP